MRGLRMRGLLESRLDLATEAVVSAGQWLMSVRGAAIKSHEAPGQQLKTDVDEIAEGMVLDGLLEHFRGEFFLCEERFEAEGRKFAPTDSYWTVDALDGTRSFVEGYEGFCVQVAYVQDGAPVLGLIFEPVRQTLFFAVVGAGAFVRGPLGQRPLRLASAPELPQHMIFADSTPPRGPVGRVVQKRQGRFLECGSIGLKICRVAEGKADVYAKALTFKLWDVAPGEVILSEAGGRLGLWDGQRIRYDTGQVYYDNILAAPNHIFGPLVHDLQLACEVTSNA